VAENRVEAKGARFVVKLPLVEAGAETGAAPAGTDAMPLAERGKAASLAESQSAVPRVRDVIESEAADGRGGGEGEVVANPLEGIRALLVEDEPDSREVLARLLAGCGADVRVAGNVAEALRLLGRERPDLLISDIAMPGETGYDLIERIRARPPEEGGTIPAIAVTAYAGAEDARRALRAGYQAHLSKPIQLRELVRLVSELVNGSPGAPEATGEAPRPPASHGA